MVVRIPKSMMSISEVACGPSNSCSNLVRFSEKFMDFLCNMNIIGISREGAEGCGKGGAHVDNVNILKMDGCC